jgi:TonB-dependent SusC/RagA subfamily outer membrane receptor
MKKNKFISNWFFCSLFFLISAITHAQVGSDKVNSGIYKTIYEMLREVPGLDVKISNDRSGGTIVVRGATSLKNQKPPLFVVDGSIFSGDIGNINPQDVDEISVLKDAASTAEYGAQGAFGVIIITTKKGATPLNTAVVSTYNKSAYTYFIEHKTNLKVIGLSDEVIVQGVIKEQRDSVLVFMKKKKELLVSVKNIKKVEMITQ